MDSISLSAATYGSKKVYCKKNNKLPPNSNFTVLQEGAPSVNSEKDQYKLAYCVSLANTVCACSNIVNRKRSQRRRGSSGSVEIWLRRTGICETTGLCSMFPPTINKINIKRCPALPAVASCISPLEVTC